MRISVLGALLCGLIGFSRAAPAFSGIGRVPFLGGMMMFYPAAPFLERAITEPEGVGFFVRGINPALRFINAIGRAVHPGELIDGLGSSNALRSNNYPLFAEFILKRLNKIRMQASENLHNEVNLASKRKAYHSNSPELLNIVPSKDKSGAPVGSTDQILPSTANVKNPAGRMVPATA